MHFPSHASHLRDASYRTLYLTKQLEHLPVECRDIVGLATGHELAIDNYFLIHPLRPGILRVCLERRPRSNLLSLRVASLDHRPGPVADDSDRFTRVEKCLRERNPHRADNT